MSKAEIKTFLEKNKDLLDKPSVADDFLKVLKHETLRQVKDQLATELSPLLSKLSSIEGQQAVIIRLLERKLDFDVQEKRIWDMLEKALEKEQ